MAAVPPHPSTVHDAAAAAGYAAPHPQHAAQANVQSLNQSAEFFLSNYRLGRTLGIGSFGKVKVAEHILTGHKVAIKILNRRKIQAMDMEEKVRREIKILRLFMHPHIIRLYEVIETATDIYVVMEYVKGGELFDHIVEKGRLPEEEARHFFQQIISGVEYCHRNMVVHRDLKPENLLLDSRLAVKIADFGLSNVMRDGHFLKTSCGSPNYAAPEVISGKLYAGPEVDVWSCGVILYALLCGSLPFDDENIPNLFKKIKGGIYNLPSHLSPGARDLIPRMLLVDPLKRITIPEVRCHPWFTEHLPRYLAVMQADTAVTSPRLDEEMINEVVRMGFDREHLVTSIRTRQQNKATVTYWLLLDARRPMPSSGYLSAELNEAAAAAAHQAAMQGQQQQQQYLQGQSGLGHPSYPSGTRAQHGGIGHHHSGGLGDGHGLPQQRLVAERKWRLGWHARGHPSALMAEVYRVLQVNQVSWKKLGPYNLKCRKVVLIRPRLAPPQQQQQQQHNEDEQIDSNNIEAMETSASTPTAAAAAANGPEAMQHDGGFKQQQQQQQQPQQSGSSVRISSHSGIGVNVGNSSGSSNHNTGQAGGYVEHVLKFEAQMYKIRDDEYAIDMQRLDGELLMFMDVCGRLLGDIRA